MHESSRVWCLDSERADGDAFVVVAPWRSLFHAAALPKLQPSLGKLVRTSFRISSRVCTKRMRRQINRDNKLSPTCSAVSRRRMMPGAGAG